MSRSNGAIVLQSLRLAAKYREKTIMLVTSQHINALALYADIEVILGLGIEVIISCVPGEAPMNLASSFPEGVSFYNYSTSEDLIDQAKRQSAQKICFLTSFDWLMNEKEALSSVSVLEAKCLVESESLSEIAKMHLRFAIKACAQGISRVHYVNGNRPGALLCELFTDSGEGTMIFADVHCAVRAATRKDILDIARLSGQTVIRDERPLVEAIARYLVLTIDEDVHACMKIQHTDHHVEISDLYADELMGGQLLVKRLLEEQVTDARNDARKVVIVESEVPPLVLIQPWFNRLGFSRQTVTVAGRQRMGYVTM